MLPLDAKLGLDHVAGAATRFGVLVLVGSFVIVGPLQIF